MTRESVLNEFVSGTSKFFSEIVPINIKGQLERTEVTQTALVILLSELVVQTVRLPDGKTSETLTSDEFGDLMLARLNEVQEDLHMTVVATLKKLWADADKKQDAKNQH